MDGGDVAPGIPRTVSWVAGRVRLVDQRALPGALRFVDCGTIEELCDAIRSMAVRGAPALGAAGAYGVALAASAEAARSAAEALLATRPTAVNLAWGVGRALDAYERGGRGEALAEAQRLAEEDVARCRAIGGHGVALVPQGGRVLTHCNAGSLACVEYGTAVGVIRAAAEAGRRPRVWVDETRPVLQGSRLTAWELQRLGVEATLVADAAAGSLMARGEVDLVVVGADRIAANGDVANKVGTYPLAVLARHHGLPFYVAAPSSTIDPSLATGGDIPIEERAAEELVAWGGEATAPEGFPVANPAFDVTPADLVTAIVTEDGIHRPPFDFTTSPPV